MRKKIIGLVLSAAVMVMGAGYAWWTDALTLHNTVSTGVMDVEFTGAWGPIGWDGTNQNYLQLGPATFTPKALSVEVGNMYPNTIAEYWAEAKNKGTIPAVVDSVTVTMNQDSAELDSNLIVVAGYALFGANGNYKGGNWCWAQLGNLESALDGMLAGVRMEPGDKIYFDIPKEYQDDVKAIVPLYDPAKDNCIIFYLPYTADNDVQNQTAKFDISINYGQHNQF